MLDDAGCDAIIEVDGGVKLDNVKEVLQAGADTIVAGSAVFRGDPAANTEAFFRVFNEYEK